MTVADFGQIPDDWCWQSIGEDEALEQWRHLTAWVGWLRGRYPIAEQLPGCWWRHSELVEELTAVWLAWHGAYTDPRGHPGAPADFHDRVLPSFLGRVRRWGVQCLDEHRPRPGTVYAANAVDDPQAFADFTADPYRIKDDSGPGRGWLDFLPLTAVNALIDEGFALPASGSPSPPLRIHHDYWLPTSTGYVRVSDPVLHRQLARTEARTRPAPTRPLQHTLTTFDAPDLAGAHDDHDDHDDGHEEGRVPEQVGDLDANIVTEPDDEHR